jgi:hypothetical protein
MMMRSRAHPLHRVIVDDDRDNPVATNCNTDSVTELCSELEMIRDRLDRLQATRSMTFLDLTIQALKRENDADLETP